MPPIWEQQAIATYLDNETTKIDAQINEKQRLIKLLQERRNTLISQFVTKGLDPTVEMKASDVEWIGEIPSHWEVVQLKFAITMNPEVLSENTDPDYTIQYVDIGNVDSNGRVVGSEELRFEDAPSRARRLVRHGDTIISTVRTYLKSIGFINSPPENLIVSTGFAVLRPHPNLHPPFLAWQVQSAWFIDTVVAYSEGIGYPAINPGQLASLPILIPPLAEQQTISDFLNQETDKIDRLIAINQQPIEKLQEYRASLVSAAVTGKLDLREQINDEAQYTWEF